MSLDVDRVGHGERNQPADITQELHDVSLRPIAYGGFADIYSGIWSHDGKEVKVAIKVLRVRTLDPASEKLLRQLRGEISVWKRLSHPNIHRLCGLCEGMGPGPAMVSPWYGNGDINAYVARNAANPELDTLKLNLFFDVTSGLRFPDMSCAAKCTIISSFMEISKDSQSIAHTGVKGTSRWMAPELILNEEVHSYASDVWAAGCLLMEIWCALQPYHTKKNDHQVMLALSCGEQPARPPAMPDFPWSLVEMCCDFEPGRRPLPLRLMSKLAVQLTMPVVARMVMRGRPLDDSSVALLRAIELSLNTADSHLTAQLRSISESGQ
ncbi:kinase-like protein [Exidia glandulosa HHB12029]|uniref:Kinase-like protein n=1 Tax=Exidia glandulosa HHB12029 TaxID=1314781 RepID=A0A165JWD1_EXIGL|nr:kinase-like protein [Exidia glandulosa HHB12029]